MKTKKLSLGNSQKKRKKKEESSTLPLGRTVLGSG
jgi:hypothetical protein